MFKYIFIIKIKLFCVPFSIIFLCYNVFIIIFIIFFLFRHGDWVEFRIATDRRDQLKRATNISLLPESFVVSGERREQGIIAVLKQGFGFLRSVEREPKIYFTFNEVLEVQRKLECNDEVEFTVAQVLFSCKLFLVVSSIKYCLFNVVNLVFNI